METVYKKFSFVNHQKILTLFNVVAMASSCNDLDRDDNAKFIVATIKRIKNILWNILFLDTDGITNYNVSVWLLRVKWASKFFEREYLYLSVWLHDK